MDTWIPPDTNPGLVFVSEMKVTLSPSNKVTFMAFFTRTGTKSLFSSVILYDVTETGIKLLPSPLTEHSMRLIPVVEPVVTLDGGH